VKALSLLILARNLVLAIVLVTTLIAETREGQKFTVRVIEVDRNGSGCTAQVASEKVDYMLRSDVSAACAMLVAGNEYQAYRGTVQNDSADEGKDSPVLVIFNVPENKRRPNAAFDIVSEKEAKLKPCPKGDPLGLRTDEPCQPLPAQRKK
jgi:hypothetical protein